MATYPQTGSTLTSAIRTTLSPQITIQVELPNGGGIAPVGAVSEITDDQNRPLARITEIGTDGTIEIVPQRAAEGSLRLQRTMFDNLALFDAFGQGFRNIQSQRFPFNIQLIDKSSAVVDADGVADPTTVIITTYVNCWFTSISTPISTSNYQIVQTAQVWYEYVSTLRAGQAVASSQGAGGGRQILSPNSVDSIEAAADSGKRLGALDFGGIFRRAGVNTLVG